MIPRASMNLEDTIWVIENQQGNPSYFDHAFLVFSSEAIALEQLDKLADILKKGQECHVAQMTWSEFVDKWRDQADGVMLDMLPFTGQVSEKAGWLDWPD